METRCSSGLSLKWKFSSGSASTARDPSGCSLAPNQESMSDLHMDVYQCVHMCKVTFEAILSKSSCISFPICPRPVPRTVKIPDSADGLGFQIRGFGPSVVHAVGRGKRSLPPQLELSAFIRKRPPVTFLLLRHSWWAAATPASVGVRDLATWGQFSPSHALHVAQLVV